MADQSVRAARESCKSGVLLSQVRIQWSSVKSTIRCHLLSHSLRTTSTLFPSSPSSLPVHEVCPVCLSLPLFVHLRRPDSFVFTITILCRSPPKHHFPFLFFVPARSSSLSPRGCLRRCSFVFATARGSSPLALHFIACTFFVARTSSSLLLVPSVLVLLLINTSR